MELFLNVTCMCNVNPTNNDLIQAKLCSIQLKSDKTPPQEEALSTFLMLPSVTDEEGHCLKAICSTVLVERMWSNTWVSLWKTLHKRIRIREIHNDT